MTIAVTGASGALGRVAAEVVLQSTDPANVVLTTRNPDSLADFAAHGASVRRADFSDPASLATAFAGVDKLLLISTDAGGARLNQHLAAISAASQAGVRHIAYTSVPQPISANPALVVADHAATEQAIKDSGMAWTMLRNNLYTHMQVPGIEHAAASGQWVANSGAGAAEYVTREDCAAVAAAVLTQDGHDNHVYDITGPRAWSAADLAALAGEIGDREIQLVQVDDEAYRDGLVVQAGLPQAVAGLLTSFGASTRGGFLADVSPTVEHLTGRPATELDTVVRSTLNV
ncbi:SDR family oxidoreductase [Jatrophihabitans lederbergiae]|uniref:SDR family oxidoreductase n=1 Tax=Jatrophihabitans lederbergiae TaxID=3075547 RepID=A0ABU2JHC6_9ACTN|nr:SDR family oxidoreductase [Jatrophihabitans sp. DSM 44399]MDT0264387.1 SDR family oxidoreductase [Jatrophihabitans sp. DSM 44399]